MSGQIIFFKKSKCDFSLGNVIASASQGSAYAAQVLNRSNLSAWVTTGSVDADNTTLTVDMSDPKVITDLLLLKHNFKAFTLKYWNGTSYQPFSPAINETSNTAASSYYEVASVTTTKLQITITGTQVANADKYLYQFIATSKIGRLNGWPIIESPVFDRNKLVSVMLSGKISLAESLGGFKTSLTVEYLKDSTDLATIEAIFGSADGFLVWLTGGDETQFSSVRQGYRMEDVFLMKCVNSLSPQWYQGLYQTGMTLQVDLAEAVD